MYSFDSALVGALVLLGVVVLVGVGTAGVIANAVVADAGYDERTPSFDEGEMNVSEPAYVEPVPEPGDEYYEARAPDGSWVSYVNPRDEYRSPYVGDGSGKICVVLLNEAGDPIVGESVPGTTVTIPTGERLDWHTQADPMVVAYPLTEHYDRPLDADQFGTSTEVVQGDGYMDSHCIEFHGLPEDGEISYGEATIDGAHAEKIDLVGYLQQDDQAWDSDVDPLEEAVSHEAAGGGWTYQEPLSHGQAVVVLQLNASVTGVDVEGSDAEAGDTETGDEAGDTETGDEAGDTETGDEQNTSADSSDGAAERNDSFADDGTVDDRRASADETTDHTDEAETDEGLEAASDETATDELPGFGSIVTVVAVVTLVGILVRRREQEDATDQ